MTVTMAIGTAPMALPRKPAKRGRGRPRAGWQQMLKLTPFASKAMLSSSFEKLTATLN